MQYGTWVWDKQVNEPKFRFFTSAISLRLWTEHILFYFCLYTSEKRSDAASSGLNIK